MTEDDIEAVTNLVMSTPLWQRHGVQRQAFLARLESGLAQAAAIDLAETRPQVGCQSENAGFIWYVAAGAFQRSGYIMLIGVHAGFQGRGVGRLLMAHAEAMLAPDADDILLLVSDFNRPAQHFYTRLGYHQVGAIPDYVTPGVTEFIYYKRFSKRKGA